MVSDNLKWDKQCSETVIEANNILGMIKQNFSDNSKETIIPWYESLVRPHLEYCCHVWSPHYNRYKAFRRCTVSGYKIGIWHEIIVLCR